MEYVKKNYGRVLPIFLVAGVLNGLVFVLFVNATTFPNIPPNLTNLTQVNCSKLRVKRRIATGYVWLEYFLSWFILYFATGVAIWQMSRAPLNPLAMNNDVNAGSPTTLNYAKLGLATFVSVLLVSLGLFLFLIGAVVIGVMLYLVLPVAVLEDKSVGSAISRSRQLVSGRRVKTFILLVGWLLFAYIVSNVFGGLIILLLPTTATTNLIALFAQNFALALLFPFVAASMLVLYQSKPSTTTKTSMKRVPTPPTSPYDSMKPEPMWTRPPSPESTPGPNFCSNCGSQPLRTGKLLSNCGRAIRELIESFATSTVTCRSPTPLSAFSRPVLHSVSDEV